MSFKVHQDGALGSYSVEALTVSSLAVDDVTSDLINYSGEDMMVATSGVGDLTLLAQSGRVAVQGGIAGSATAVYIVASDSGSGVTIAPGTSGKVTVTAPVWTTSAGTIASGTTTLTAHQSGTFYNVTPTSAVVFNLPVPAHGIFYEFLIPEVPGTLQTITFTATSTFLYGTVLDGDGPHSFAGQTSLIVSATAMAGTVVSIQGVDSTHWKVSGASEAAGTFSTA